MGCGVSIKNTKKNTKNTKDNKTLTEIVPNLNYQNKRPSSINTKIPLRKKFLVG